MKAIRIIIGLAAALLLFRVGAHGVVLLSEINYELTELVLRWIVLVAVLVFVCLAIILLANYEDKQIKNESNN